MFKVGIDRQFEDDEKMFIPLNIDDVEVDETSYFLSGKKFIIAAVSIIPYTFIFFVIDQIPNIFVFLMFTLIYMIGYSFILRFWVFEEKKQRESMRSLKQNKLSNMSYFWELDKVGNGKKDSGMLYKQTDGVTIQRSYIVELDGGSTVGLNPNAYSEYRTIWQEFFRECYKMGFDVKIYQERKRPELSNILKHYSSELKNNKDTNDMLRQLLQLNIETNYLYSNTDEQRYVAYIEVLNRRIDNLIHFRGILEDILDKTFRKHSIFSDPKILDKVGVDRFFALHYGQTNVNSNGLHMSSGFKDITDFIDVVMIVDRYGKPIPFNIMDDLGLVEEGSRFGKYGTLDKVMEDIEGEQFERDAKIKKSLETKLKELRELRRSEKITYDEYVEKVKEVKEQHKPENVTEDIVKTETQKKRDLREMERLERKEKQEMNRKRREQEKEINDKKWYEKEEQPDKVKVTRKSFSKIRDKDFVDLGVTLDDLFEDN